MTLEIGFVLTLLVIVMSLLAFQKLPIELVSLLLVTTMAATGILGVGTAFEGFANETVVMLACVMVLSHRLSASGLVARVTKALFHGHKMGERKLGAALMSVSALMSSFLTNTSTTALLIPAATDLAQRNGTHPGRFLMPLAFASMMGGSATLIGTSTNLAASGAAERLGLARFHIFEFAAVGAIVSVIGIAVLALFGPLFLPGSSRSPLGPSPKPALFRTTLTVPEGSRHIGEAISDLNFAPHDVTVLAINRAEGRVEAHPRRKLIVDDRIIIEGSRDAILAAIADPDFNLTTRLGPNTEMRQNRLVADAVVMPGARWLGQTVTTMRAAIDPELSVLALNRRGQSRPALGATSASKPVMCW